MGREKMLEVSISELKRDLSGVINRTAYGKQRVIIVSRGKPKAAMISIEDLHLLEGLSQKKTRQVRQMAALEAARAIRAEIAEQSGGPLPDSSEELRQLREERGDEILSVC
jgi:prevent-host-death family protein